MLILKQKAKIIIPVAIILLLAIAALLLNKPVARVIYPIKFQATVEKYAEKYSLDKYYVYAVIKTESGFDENAKSHAGACGLMQLMSDTANWMNEKYSLGYSSLDLFDAETNICIGCCYLRYLFDKFDTNALVAAAYNGGEGNVKKWLNNSEYSADGVTLSKIPFKETSNYVKKVTKGYDIYKKLYS